MGHRIFHWALCTSAALAASGCVTYRDVGEIKLIAFSDNVSKGQATGQFTSDDCVFEVLGYSLGGNPQLSTAIANAQTGKKTSITDVAGTSGGNNNQSIRYANNVRANHTGFNAVVFGKRCIEVTGMGYR